jgi:hypothetical protein
MSASLQLNDCETDGESHPNALLQAANHIPANLPCFYWKK